MRYIKHKIWCNAAKLYKIYIIQEQLYKNNGPEGHMIWGCMNDFVRYKGRFLSTVISEIQF
jgi:hypothetical protein